MQQDTSASPASKSPLDFDTLVTTIHARFRPPYRERITRDDVAQIVRELDLSDDPVTMQTPRLRVRRLRFTGEKHLQDEKRAPIDYDQVFAPGVNMILIADNQVGKSSIMKTIKFALTGDNSDYDADVRTWIKSVHLVFSLDQRVYTIVIDMNNDKLEAVLVPGEVVRALADIGEHTSFVFRAAGSDNVRSELQSFFFRNLGLTTLSWNQHEPSSGELVKRNTSWLTYFQALVIADGSDRYLICDPQHSMGNQDGLIISTFLSLSLTEPLNKLSVELSRATRSVQQEQRLSREEQETANQQIAELEAAIQTARQKIAEIDQTQRLRRRAFDTSDPLRELTAAQHLLAEKSAERLRLEQERDALTGQIKRVRSAGRRLREQAALALHFTGLTVSLCPNCDTPVSQDAVTREQATHECRLCGTPANAASVDEIVSLEAEADRADQEAQHLDRGRAAIGARLATLRREIEQLNAELPVLKQAVERGLDRAFPTEEENAERERQLLEIGRCQGEISVLRARLSTRQPDVEALDNRTRILEKIRDAFREEAARRNASHMERLSMLTQDFARQIGVESMSDFTCTPLGKVQLRKHGEVVSFTGIRNEGERLRIKLAFFTAMMRLGREPGLGRHPGFLLIDQPGSSEMVADDFHALAGIFRHLDHDLSDDVQVICFTARPEFATATDPSKVYGATVPPYAF
jgi:hypothetical protein